MSDTNEQVVELDAAAVEAIAKQVTVPEIDYDKIAEKVAEKQAIEAQKNDKEINKLATGKKEAIEGEIVSEFEKMSKEAFLVAQLSAIRNKNFTTLGELNKVAIQSRQAAGMVTKTDADMNATTTADGGAFVPNAQLMTDVFDALPKYSGVANLLRVVTLTTGDSLDISSITADVTFTEVSTEAGTKTQSVPTIASTTVSVREWAAVVPITKKLLNQSAIDVYATVRNSLARGLAKNREKLALSDSSDGIISTSGVVAKTTGTASTANAKLSSITPQMVQAMPFSVPTSSAAGGTFVFSRLLLAQLATAVDANNRPLTLITPSAAGGVLSGTFASYPFVVAETLGTSDAASTTHAVFGNWGEYGVLLRQGTIDTALFDSGTTGGYNLIDQNMVALRSEVWENVGYPIPGAFVTLSTAAAS